MRYLKKRLQKAWRTYRLALIIALVVILWSSTFWLIANYKSPNSIGDSFGMVNALFSGLAFAFLIYGYWMQRKELEMQREEMKMQREELRLTRIEMKQSTKALQEQVSLTRIQIENERERLLAEFKPDLEILFLNLNQQGLEARLKAPLNKCILKDVLIKKIGDNEVKCQEHSRIVESGKSITISPMVEISQDGIFHIIVDYRDQRGNSYNQIAVVEIDNMKIKKLNQWGEQLGIRTFNDFASYYTEE